MIFQAIIIAGLALSIMIQLSTLGLMKQQQDDLINALQAFDHLNLPTYQVKPSPMDSFDVSFGDVFNETATPSATDTGK